LPKEIGSRLSTRVEGRCIKHYMGPLGVKVYDKFSRVLRVETTVNDVSFFKHHRKVEHKGEATTRELAPLKKSIYSLIDLRDILLGCSLGVVARLIAVGEQVRVRAPALAAGACYERFSPARCRLLRAACSRLFPGGGVSAVAESGFHPACEPNIIVR
jgi:hypothetical protein